MNSLEIEKIVRKDVLLWRTFHGVFASDQLKFRVTKRPCCMIVNTDTSNLPGSHWVAIYFDVKGDAEYFDSFGRSPISPFIDQFLKLNGKTLVFNNQRLQSSDSFVCGMYCIYFLFNRVRQLNIVKQFSHINFMQNDRLVCRFMYKHFRIRHNVCFQ
jgi:hypothetical protein